MPGEEDSGSRVNSIAVTDDPTYHWLHNRYQEMLMHEDELLNDRISFMLTASSIFIGAYFIAAEVSPSHPISTVTSLILAGVGIFLCVYWFLVVKRTIDALELWRGILLRFERPKLDSVHEADRLQAIYWQHEQVFHENAVYRGRHHDTRAIGLPTRSETELGIPSPGEGSSGKAPLAVQLMMPLVFLGAWIAIVIVTALHASGFIP